MFHNWIPHLLHIYCTLITSFGKRGSIAVNGVPSMVSQVIPTYTSHILSGFHSYSDVSVQTIPFEDSFNITSVMIVKIATSYMYTYTVSVKATSSPGDNTLLTISPFKLDHVKSYWLRHDVSFRSTWWSEYSVTFNTQFSLVHIKEVSTFNLVKHIFINLRHLWHFLQWLLPLPSILHLGPYFLSPR